MNREKYEKALEHIKTLRGSNFGEYYSRFSSSSLTFDEDYNALKELLNEYCKLKELVKQQEENRWISVEERMPEQSLNSVIGWDAYRERCCFVQYYMNEWILGNHETVKIVAWMPLPEPYKGETE